MTDYNNTIKQLDVIDIYRTLHPTTTVCKVFSSAYGTSIKINNILARKTNVMHLTGFKPYKVWPDHKVFWYYGLNKVFSDHKLKMNNIKISGKSPNV